MIEELIKSHETHLLTLEKNDLITNLDKLNPQTYNRKKSAEIRKALNTEVVNKFFEECVNKYCET